MNIKSIVYINLYLNSNKTNPTKTNLFIAFEHFYLNLISSDVSVGNFLSMFHINEGGTYIY